MKFINNKENGLTIRNKINDNFNVFSGQTTESILLNDLYVRKGRDNFILKEGVVFENFDNVSDWVKESAAGELTQETTNVKEGTASVRLDTTDADAFFDKTIDASIVGGGVMSLMIYVEELQGLNSVAIYFTSDEWYDTFFSKEIQGYELHEGWNYISISQYEWFNWNDEDWNNTFVKMRIRVNCTSGSPVVVFDGIYDARTHKPKCVITFDDGHITAYNRGYKYMADNGLRGTHYLNGSTIGTADFVNAEQLEEMYRDRWCLANHGYSHDDLTTLGSVQDIKNDLIQNEEFLSSLGFDRSIKHLAYPYGGYNDDVFEVLEELNYKTARTIIDRDQGNFLDERYLLTRMGVFNTTSIETAKGFIDAAIVRGTACMLNFHRIVDEDATLDTQVLTSVFNELIDYIKNRQDLGLIDVVTIDEWYNGLKGYIRI